MVVMYCMAEIGNWRVVTGFIVHARADWYAYDRNSGSFRSWGHGVQTFGEAGVMSTGVLALDVLTLVMAEALDDYLEVNLGTREAVIANRGEYPPEQHLTELRGPMGAKVSR